MRFLKCFAYILAEIAIIAATSYINNMYDQYSVI